MPPCRVPASPQAGLLSICEKNSCSFLPLLMDARHRRRRQWNSGDPLDALGDLPGLEDLLPVRLHQSGLAELNRLVAGVRENPVDFLENYCPQHVHMAEKEIAG